MLLASVVCPQRLLQARLCACRTQRLLPLRLPDTRVVLLLVLDTATDGCAGTLVLVCD